MTHIRPAYWWTTEIAEIRKKCLHLRRQLQRIKKRCPINPEDLTRSYKQTKKELRQAFKSSKRKCWWTMAEELNTNPWGLGYKLVTRKLGAFTHNAEQKRADFMKEAVNLLFPDHPI